VVFRLQHSRSVYVVAVVCLLASLLVNIIHCSGTPMTPARHSLLAIILDTCSHTRLSKAIMSILSPLLPTRTLTNHHVDVKQSRYVVVNQMYEKSMEEFTEEVRALFGQPLDLDRLLEYSGKLQEQYKEKLRSSNISMLPSYQHTLPTGFEEGDFLALDVGGSTFRVALIRLCGKKGNGENDMQIRRIRNVAIDKKIRDLQGEAFFDWMADRIADMLAEYNHINGTTDARLPMGLAWSFPVEQTSPRTGKLLAMGKGFCATHGCEGEDLSELIMRSCNKKGVNVEMRAIVNDGSATLVSQAYRDPTARMSLILGTGMNASVYLPTSALSQEKFGNRPAAWFASAKHVLVNTELSMYGKHILPITRWDEHLNATHRLPDFQPLEYLCTGRYLGEIVRLVLLEAISTAGLFAGALPLHLAEPYSLDTRLLAAFEADSTPSLSIASAAFLAAHPVPSHSQSDWPFILILTQLVSRRAQSYLAVALHALWAVRTSAEGLRPADAASHVVIACNGTVAEKYPGFLEGVQRVVNELCAESGARTRDGTVKLEMARESSLFGAAVAVCCAEGR
jgi:hexokinase